MLNSRVIETTQLRRLTHSAIIVAVVMFLPACGTITICKQTQPPAASPTPAPSVPPGLYRYTIAFNVPVCGLGHVELNGALGADNDATAILDTTTIATCTNCFGAPVSFNVNVPALSSAHVLEIDV